MLPSSFFIKADLRGNFVAATHILAFIYIFLFNDTGLNILADMAVYFCPLSYIYICGFISACF